MTASTVDRDTPCQYPQRQGHAPLANPSVVPAGVIVAVNASGLIPTGGSSDAAGLIVVGRSEHSASYADGDRELVFERGVFGFAMTAGLAAVAQANVGRTVYLKDNATVGLSSDTTAKIPAGKLELVDGSTAYVAVGLFDVTGFATSSPLADAAVSPAEAPIGAPLVMSFPIPNAATADYDFVVPVKMEIIDVHVLKSAAGAGNSIQAQTGAGTAISDAIAAAVDKAITRAGTLDPATRTLAAGATLRFHAINAAGSTAAEVIVYAIPRA